MKKIVNLGSLRSGDTFEFATLDSLKDGVVINSTQCSVLCEYVDTEGDSKKKRDYLSCGTSVYVTGSVPLVVGKYGTLSVSKKHDDSRDEPQSRSKEGRPKGVINNEVPDVDIPDGQFTILEFATLNNLDKNLATRHIKYLLKKGKLKACGSRKTGGRGKPSNLFCFV